MQVTDIGRFSNRNNDQNYLNQIIKTYISLVHPDRIKYELSAL